MASNEHITYRIIPARSGDPTLIISRDGKDIPLHSTVDPLKEAAGWSDRFDPGRFDTLIVLGAGLGYHLMPLEKLAASYTFVILIDILDGIDVALSKSAAGFLARNPKVRIISGLAPEQVAVKLNDLVDLSATRGISVLEHPASIRIFSEYYREVKKEIEAIINKKACNQATIRAFGTKYFKNILANVRLIGEFRPVSELFGLFTGQQALVVTSGPSLDRCIEVIRKLTDRCFIIAVDSALPVLDRHGIIPDFAVSIDPQPYIYEHLMRSSPGPTVPVISISASPWAFRWACGRETEKVRARYLSLNSHPLSQLISSLGWDAGSIESGTGNVAGDAVMLAMRLGFSSIALAGFDFSFPRYSIYARGTAYQMRYAVYFQDRFTTVEGRNAAYIFTASGRTRRDGLYTRKSFIQYRESLEALIGGFRGNIFSIRGEGLEIAGAPATPEEGFCSAPVLHDKRGMIMSLSLNAQADRKAFDLSALKRALEDRKLFSELVAASTGDASMGKKLARMIPQPAGA